MKKLLPALLAAGALLTAAACDPPADAAPAKHHKVHKAHKTASRLVTAKGHTEGTSRYFLTLKGAKRPATVTNRTFKRCQIGDRFPGCADG